MAITPAGKRRAQVSQGGFKHESIFDDNVNQLLRKLSATGTSVEEPQAGIDQQLQDATASPQLTDPARNVPEMETKQQTQPAGQAGQAVQGQQPDQQYPVMPGSMESLPPTQRAVAELLIQKAKEQGLIVDGFTPRVKSFDFQDGNIINIRIDNNAGAKISPGGRL